jgi:hypothetical protein
MTQNSDDFLADNPDLQFYIDHWIDWAKLAEAVEYKGFSEALADAGDGYASVAEAREVYADVLQLAGQLAAGEIDPRAAAIDRAGLELVDGEVVLPEAMTEIFDTLAETGLHGMCVPREFGGMNVPMMVYFLSGELFARADVSVMAHFGFHGGIAMALLVYSALEGSATVDDESGAIVDCRFGDAVRDIVENAEWGSMDITEPGAGSDVGAMRTRGVQDADGNWSVTGQKIFITSGNGKYHIVLARTEDADAGSADADPMAGLGGLSLFLVEAWSEDAEGNRTRHVTVSGVEEKLGHHASPTVTVDFDDAPAKLIGKRGEGFKQMLLLMNNARISVGFEGLGVCEAALRMARAYAAERFSMGKTIDKHELIADYIDEMETTVVGLRAICVDAGFQEELAQRKRLRLMYAPPADPDHKKALEREVKALSWKSRLNTPLLKYLAAEAAVDMARTNLQIHGGYGYTTEYGAEKLLRDSLVLPIYEGTSQIQALMATKDALQYILKDPGAFLRKLAGARFDARFASGPRVRRVAQLRLNVMLAQRNLMMRIAGKKAAGLRGRPMTEWRAGFVDEWDMKTDFAPALLHAERLTRMMIDVRVAEVLAKQAARFEDRAPLLDRHLERAEPRSRFLLDQIRTTGERILSMLQEEPLSRAAK